jgi:PAS domain S-box-containing protein
MTIIPGYHTLEQIYESPSSLVFRAVRPEDELPVVLKVLREDYPTPDEIIRYRQEYAITRNLQHISGVIGVYSLEKHQNTLVMVLEDFGAHSLAVLQESGPLALGEFLSIAIRITEILGEVHAANIIHKDVNPANLVVNPATGVLKIIDFGISSALSRENPVAHNPEVLEGTLAYMAPEQTGRMNRSVDYRSDYYALGCSLYELITGRRPFESPDALELVHCHIARVPLPPHEVKSSIPEAVSRIVMKLLAKNAEDRYQSAIGIRADLKKCLEQYEASGSIRPFPLSVHDVPERFQIPQKLYGREEQVDHLLAAFERVTKGNKELMLVSGCPGIGKTSLVREIYKPISRRRGYFISGKFDQYQRATPFAAFVAAFRDLVRQLLREGEAQLARWKEQLLEAVGPNGQVVTGMIPEVELIIGPQPPPVEVGPIESRNRFNMVFRRFIRVFCGPGHPLAIFLDDMQWADTASLNLMEVIMTDDETQYLFVMAAFRSNEVHAADPFMVSMDGLRKQGACVSQIELEPLSLHNISRLAADALYRDEAAVAPLARILSQKTGGNPFFIREFLTALYVENILDFDIHRGAWNWDLDRLHQRCITDNVVELMTDKIQRLDPDAQEVLKLAACVGNRFELDILAIVAEKSPKETLALIKEAVNQGLILPLSDAWKAVELDVDRPPDRTHVEYKFSHDRIQQAAYSLIPAPRRPEIHLRVGRLLLRSCSPTKQEEMLFDIVNHLNWAAPLISDSGEAQEVARLNLGAGRKASASAAYETAFRYLETGVELLPEASWHNAYELTLALHVEAAEASYLSTEFESMDRLCRIVLSHARTLLDKTRVYEIKIQAHSAQNQMMEAVGAAREILRLFGTVLPEKPTKLAVMIAFLKITLALRGRTIENLAELPVATDATCLAVTRILNIATKPVYAAVPELCPLLLFKVVELSITYGNCPESVIGYAGYGFFLCGVMGEIEKGYRFGQLATRLAHRFNVGRMTARATMVINLLIAHWKEPFQQLLKPALEGYQHGLENGNLEDAAVSAFIYCSGSYHMGKELVPLEREIASYSGMIRKLRQTPSLHLNEIFRQATLNLMGLSANPCELAGEAYDEATMLPAVQQAQDRSILSVLYLNKLILCLLFQNYQEAIRNAELLESYLSGVTGTLTIPLFSYYDALARLGACSELGYWARKRVLRRVAAHQKKMKKWAHHAPGNFLHKFMLVEAERHRVRGNDSKATDWYERAVDVARENAYANDEALANELAGRFHLTRGRANIGKSYLQEARYGYLRWGAIAKVKQMDDRYGQVLAMVSAGGQSRAGASRSTVSVTGTSPDETLDLATVVKASQTLSGEIVLRRLLDKLVKIVIENAGAEKAFLILKSAGRWVIEGYIDHDRDTPQSPAAEETQTRSDGYSATMLSIPVENCPDLAAGVVNYVRHTHEYVVLNDASAEGAFANDPYIVATKPKSILCVPLIHHGRITGVLYLENNLTTAAFTPARVQLLTLLCSQASISIENARLYGKQEDYAHTLEREVAERTRELAASEAKYRTIFETTGTATLIVEEDDTISLSNSGFQRLTGYSEDEINGRKKWTEFVRAEEIYRIRQGQDSRDSRSDRSPSNYEFTLRDRGNKLKNVLLSVGMVPETRQSIASLVDITEQKTAEIALKRAHEDAAAEARKLRSLIEGLDEGIVFVDSNDSITEVNSWFLARRGISRNEAVGKRLGDVRILPEIEHRIQQIVYDFKKGLTTPLVMHRDFLGMHVSFRVHPIFHGDQYRGVILNMTDVSDLEDARERAEQASRAKGDFLATMSHELRTPLNAIIGFSEILEDQLYGTLNEKQMRYVQHVSGSGRHLLALINDILDLSKVESGKMQLRLSEVDFGRVLEDSMIMIKDRAARHELVVDLRVHDGLANRRFWLDEVKFKQIMYNLLSNAAKFTPDGGRIAVEARLAEAELLVSVADTGVGLRPADCQRIFGAFEQVDSSHARRQQGTGLGLALTRRMVELHGGRLWVESEGENKGSIFTFSIPANLREPTTQPEVAG